MSIKNPEVEQLAEELSQFTKFTKTEVIRQALLEKKDRVMCAGVTNELAERNRRFRAFLENRVWPTLPKGASRRWTRKEEDEFFGYGKDGLFK